MGAIEEERKRRQAESDDQQRSASIRGQLEREWDQREASAKVARDAQDAKSREYLEESGLGGMIRELSQLNMLEGGPSWGCLTFIWV